MMSDEAMAAVLASRDYEVQVLGIFDAANKKEVAVELCRLGEAVQFSANASVLGSDARSLDAVDSERYVLLPVGEKSHASIHRSQLCIENSDS